MHNQSKKICVFCQSSNYQALKENKNALIRDKKRDIRPIWEVAIGTNV